MAASLRKHWLLDPEVAFLDHGCPGSGATMVRLFAALYNERGDYEHLAGALAALL